MTMSDREPVVLSRNCEAVMVPIGEKVTLQKGESAYLTQALGGAFTVVVNGNMFRVAGKDADALGQDAPAQPAGSNAGAEGPLEEQRLWNEMRTCYDPEIPVNIVDLGLVYDLHVTALPEGGSRVGVKMTLTAPGCGMGEMIRTDVEEKLKSVPGVAEANVELVFDPPWNQGMMSEAARLQLGLY